MKKITENALLFRVNQLKEKMALYEDGAPPERSWAQAAGSAVGTLGASIAAPFRAVGELGNYGYNQVAKAGDTATAAIKQGAQDFGKGASNAWQYYDPANLVGTPPPNLTLTADELANNKKIADKVAADKKTATLPNAQNKWPTTHDEIVAFQNANKLNPDGKIGNKTMAALQAKGIQPPAGFKPVADKQHPAAAQHPTQQQGGTAAKPAAPAQQGAAPVAGQVMPNGTVSSGDPARDERLNQANQVMNMTTDQRHQFDMVAGQADYNAAHPTQTAQAQTSVTQTPPPATTPANATDPNSALGKQISNAIPNSAPSSAPNAQGPLGMKFQSDQIKESVTFSQEDSLARILQLAKW